MNEESGQELIKELGSSAKFFTCDVLDTESIAAAVGGAAAWAQQTGKALGGVIPAAGVSTPATVSTSPTLYREKASRPLTDLRSWTGTGKRLAWTTSTSC